MIEAKCHTKIKFQCSFKYSSLKRKNTKIRKKFEPRPSIYYHLLYYKESVNVYGKHAFDVVVLCSPFPLV